MTQQSSKKCREIAVALIEQGEAKSQKIADPVGKSEVITIDLMRRAGMFQRALKLAAETKTKNIENIIGQVVRYEEALIGLKDVGTHTVSEALGDH